MSLEVFRSIRGTIDDSAWSAAVAVELYIESSFAFDNVADLEPDQSDGLTPAEELAVAIALMNCGMAAACEAVIRAGRGYSSLYALQRLAGDVVSASGGQLMDTSLERRDRASVGEAMEATSLKAGSCGRLATSFAAGIATDDQDTCALFGNLGFNLFTYLQLVDDIRDARPSEGQAGDIEGGKKTVPLAFFYDSLETANHNCSAIIHSQVGAGVGNDLLNDYDRSGASEFGAVVAEAYLNLAKDSLAEVKARVGRVGRLESLVNSLEISHEGVLTAA